MSPEEMKFVVKKAQSTGNKSIYLCERGYMFGYNNLVSDMRSLVVLKENDCPVVYDASHSVQRPGAIMVLLAAIEGIFSSSKGCYSSWYRCIIYRITPRSIKCN